MPSKKKSNNNNNQQNKKAKENLAGGNQQPVQDEPPTAAEALLNDLFAENIRIVRDKTATIEDVNQHIEKLHALVLKFGAALTPASTSISDAILPFLLARPPTAEAAWHAAATACVLVPSVGSAIFPSIVDHLAGSVDVQIGTIASTQSFSKEHGATVIRDVFFRDLLALHQEYTNSNVDAAAGEESTAASTASSISKVRQCLRRISMTSLPLMKPDQRVRYCFMLTQVLAAATSSESTSSSLSLFNDDSAKHIFTNKKLENVKASIVIDLLELSSTALLLSRPAVVGVLVEAVNNLITRVKQARWCAAAVSVHEACMTASGVCSAILHPMAAPSTLAGAEPSGNLLMASLSGNNNNSASAMNNASLTAASPMFARSAVMPSLTAGNNNNNNSATHNNNNNKTSNNTNNSQTNGGGNLSVSFVGDTNLVQGPPALLSQPGSRSAPARRSRSASRNRSATAGRTTTKDGENEATSGSDMSDWDDEDDFAVPSSVTEDGGASPKTGKELSSSASKNKKNSNNSKNSTSASPREEKKPYNSGDRRQKSMSVVPPSSSSTTSQNQNSTSHHHHHRVAPSPSPANANLFNQQQQDNSSTGNIMFGSSSSSSSLTTQQQEQQQNTRSRALSRNNNTTVATPTTLNNNSAAVSFGNNNNNSTSKIVMRGQPSTSPIPENLPMNGTSQSNNNIDVPPPSAAAAAPSKKEDVVANTSNKNDDGDDDDDDAGDIAI